MAETKAAEGEMPALEKSGVDGLLVVDVPLEEGASLRERSRHHGLDLIAFAAPTSVCPPGTRMAWKPSRCGAGSWVSKISASTHSTLTFTRLAIPPWVNASAIDL